jgi:hypothetical protein
MDEQPEENSEYTERMFSAIQNPELVGSGFVKVRGSMEPLLRRKRMDEVGTRTPHLHSIAGRCILQSLR